MAVQITDIYKFNDGWAINVDFQKEEYRVCWVGSWREVPDLTTFPCVHGTATTTRIPHSTAVRELWAKSSTVCYGADSHIRLLDPRLQDAFPICKVAVHARQRQSIQDEFDFLRSLCLSVKNAPIVSVHPDPLVDEDGIFGFRMEQLFKVEQKKLKDHLGDIYDTLTKIHEIGIVHNDFHPGNIMQRSNGALVVIDFGRSGPVGHNIPPEKQWEGPKFSFEADNIMFERFFSCYETDSCSNRRAPN